MNILIPHSWLKEYCAITKPAREIAKRVAISGPSIERVIEGGGDFVYDAEITTNRIDAHSIVGFAREVAAITGSPFKDPFQAAALKKNIEAINKEALKYQKDTREHPYSLSISLSASACRRYCGIILDHVTVKPSPAWIKKRLEMCGIRSINNIVDITNYVMLEYGQPMHAFDADKLLSRNKKGDELLFHKTITIRPSKKGEVITTLDGECKKLPPHAIVITDDDKPLAIAGIKGGDAASITTDTNTIILESASFDPVAIRHTSRDVNLRTDASLRFEKDLHSDYAPLAIVRAVELLKEHAGAIIAHPIIDEYPKPMKSRAISFSWSTLDRMVGVTIEKRDATHVLTSLGFSLQKKGGGLLITPPFWRSADIEGEADFVEEIVRIYGYDRLPLHALTGAIPARGIEPSFFWERETKHLLKNLGWTEVYGYSLIDEKGLLQCLLSSDKALELYNPLSSDFRFMRPSLRPGLLALASEHKQKRDELKVFELSKVYHPRSNDLPLEEIRLAALHTARVSKKEMLLSMKGYVEVLAGSWLGSNANQVRLTPYEGNDPFWQKGASATIGMGSLEVGTLGLPSSQILHAWGIKHAVVLLDVNFSAMLPSLHQSRQYVVPARFPAVLRDLAIVIDKQYLYSKVVETMRQVSPLIASVELFDIFENMKLGGGNHSLAFHIAYQSHERTLTADEVEVVHQKVMDELHTVFGVELR